MLMMILASFFILFYVDLACSCEILYRNDRYARSDVNCSSPIWTYDWDHYSLTPNCACAIGFVDCRRVTNPPCPPGEYCCKDKCYEYGVNGPCELGLTNYTGKRVKLSWGYFCAYERDDLFYDPQDGPVKCNGTLEIGKNNCDQPYEGLIEISPPRCESACGASPQCDEREPGTSWCSGDIAMRCSENCSYSEEFCRTDSVDSDNGINYRLKGTCTNYLGCISGSCSWERNVDICVKDMNPDCREDPFYCPIGECKTTGLLNVGKCIIDVKCNLANFTCDPDCSTFGSGWKCSFSLTYGCYCFKDASLRPGFDQYLKEYYPSGDSCSFVYKNCEDLGSSYYCSRGRCVSYWGGGGGGCPTLFVWNGIKYENEGTLNVHARSDVTVVHNIKNRLVEEEGKFFLELRELDNFTTHIDQVKLFGLTEHGLKELKLKNAFLDEKDVTEILRKDDDVRVDLKPGKVVRLIFLSNGENFSEFVFEINGYNRKFLLYEGTPTPQKNIKTDNILTPFLVLEMISLIILISVTVVHKLRS